MRFSNWIRCALVASVSGLVSVGALAQGGYQATHTGKGTLRERRGGSREGARKTEEHDPSRSSSHRAPSTRKWGGKTPRL